MVQFYQQNIPAVRRRWLRAGLVPGVFPHDLVGSYRAKLAGGQELPLGTSHRGGQLLFSEENRSWESLSQLERCVLDNAPLTDPTGSRRPGADATSCRWIAVLILVADVRMCIASNPTLLWCPVSLLLGPDACC